jgi:hypothetical protein
MTILIKEKPQEKKQHMNQIWMEEPTLCVLWHEISFVKEHMNQKSKI